MDRLVERLSEGEAPLRTGELASLIGYSREQVRKWVDAGAVDSVRAGPHTHRRIPVEEARRLCRELGLLQD